MIFVFVISRRESDEGSAILFGSRQTVDPLGFVGAGESKGHVTTPISTEAHAESCGQPGL